VTADTFCSGTEEEFRRAEKLSGTEKTPGEGGDVSVIGNPRIDTQKARVWSGTDNHYS